MADETTRRQFLKYAGVSGTALGVGNLAFLTRLPAVSAQEARVSPRLVRLDAGIEPLVRLIEETPQSDLLEKVAQRIRQGTSYQQVVAALFLAAIRNVQPRPSVGFKFHAVMVVNAAHMTSLSSPEGDRWLPIFWALDEFKTSQAQEQKDGGWRMAPVDDSSVPPAAGARQAFIEAMESWDEKKADGAAAGLVRSATANEIYELFYRFGARDFRDIGHKAIFVANSWRTLQFIGWQPMFRAMMRGKIADLRIDDVKPLVLERPSGAIEEILSDVSSNRMNAAKKIRQYLNDGGKVQDLMNAARRLIFLKGQNAHDYKFSAGVLEDYFNVSPAWRGHFLATSVFNLKGSGERDNPLVERTRAALKI